MPKSASAKSSGLANVLTTSDESTDLAFGQIVVVTARWILVTAGLVLALWLPDRLEQLRITIVVILLLAVANFYLHAQLLRRRPAVDVIAYAASAADLAVITLLVASQGGFTSDLYIFYFPAILAISVAFPTVIALGFAAVTFAAYALVGYGSGLGDGDLQVLVTRLIMLAAVGVCGNMYWRIERDRRAAAAEAQSELAAEIRAR